MYRSIRVHRGGRHIGFKVRNVGLRFNVVYEENRPRNYGRGPTKNGTAVNIRPILTRAPHPGVNQWIVFLRTIRSRCASMPSSRASIRSNRVSI